MKLIVAILMTVTTLAGVDNAYLMSKNNNHNTWTVECDNGDYEIKKTEDILNNNICGTSTIPTRECYESAKKTIPAYEIDDEEERFTLVRACSNKTKSELGCFEFVKKSIPTYGIDSLAEVVNTLKNCTGVTKKDLECAEFITAGLPTYKYDTPEEIFSIFNKCKISSI